MVSLHQLKDKKQTNGKGRHNNNLRFVHLFKIKYCQQIIILNLNASAYDYRTIRNVERQHCLTIKVFLPKCPVSKAFN
jgi:hypothetical protein